MDCVEIFLNGKMLFTKSEKSKFKNDILCSKEHICVKKEKYIICNANYDCVVNVRDATYIQNIIV